MMVWTNLHAPLIARAFARVLGHPIPGAMAFVRCLTPEVVTALAKDATFKVPGWEIWRVADAENTSERTLTADRAVELREAKNTPVLLLVDTAQAGAGMDGIYSAAREIAEASLFNQAQSEATKDLPRKTRLQAEQAIKKAHGFGRRFSVSPWVEFDFLVRLVAEQKAPGALLYLLGLWPVQQEDGLDWEDALRTSRHFVDSLLGVAAAGLTPSQRIEALKLLKPTGEQRAALERFLWDAAMQPVFSALAALADQPQLWVNALKVESAAQDIQSIELVPWQTRTGKIAKWSGLQEGKADDDPPRFILRPEADKTGNYSKLEVRWKAHPDTVANIEYRVVIVTDMDEELAVREVLHAAKKEQKCRFTNDDFPTLSDDALISAKVMVAVNGNDQVTPQESDEFSIEFGEPPTHEPAGVGQKVRTFSEGLIELENREEVSALAVPAAPLPLDSKGFRVLRTPQKRGKSFRVFQPALLREVEQQWADNKGAVGRWRVKVRASGARTTSPEFVALTDPGVSAEATRQPLWDRVVNASRRLAERFEASGGVGQVYDEKSKAFETVIKEYLLAWAALLENGDPTLALANTVEVQTLSGKTIGLIVLPSHSLRVAWHVAYDNLVLHAAFTQKETPKDIRAEFTALDSAMFPAFLPGLENTGVFIFADTLGFHTVGMVPDYDKEPKAAVAILARALGENESADTVPTVGKQSAQVLGAEILRYIECHGAAKILHVHALRPGDGLTVARSLGRVQEHYRSTPAPNENTEGNEPQPAPAFVLELYPSDEQRGRAGQFIAEAREKRRSGAGVLAVEDRWMLESLSLPGGMNLPKLRWARKTEQGPKTPAHIAIAFDTFESRVTSEAAAPPLAKPLFAYGLLSFFEREYTHHPFPQWRSSILVATDGEKHPTNPAHTDRLIRLQQVVGKCVARSLAADSSLPVLLTEISVEKADSLRELHRQCDWVITLDRNGGVEYFDSPRDNREVYDIYVIDCVPEREDLGCLQLITSTSNLAEVRNLLDQVLDQMGLSRSRRNAEFLQESLKALSGRLAIRLTSQKPPTSELVALALSYESCRQAQVNDECWTALTAGFLIPVDDVLDMLPPLLDKQAREQTPAADLLASHARPDLIYVSVVPRKGLTFQFIEVKYRRHLRDARTPDVLESLRRQTQALRQRWDKWYSEETSSASFRAVRRAKLARVLRFYAAKARRHHLPQEQYKLICDEIDRMVEKGGDYSLRATDINDRGWVFCPEYAGAIPMRISPDDWETQVFLFGPGQLPDSSFHPEPLDMLPPEEDKSKASSASTLSEETALVSSASSTLQNAPQPESSEEIENASLPTIATSLSAVTNTTWQEPAIRLGHDLLTGAEVHWTLTTKGNPHLLVAGLPGMGKTTCLLNLCKQMLSAGVRPIVFSYHQDIDERLQDLVNDVRFIDFHGLGFNPLQVIDRQSRLAYLDVAGAVRDIFVAIYPELGDVQGERIRQAIKESFVERGWNDASADLPNLVVPPFGRFVELLRADPKPDRGLRTLLGRLEELNDYGFFDTTETSQSLWESEKPIVIRIHSTQNDNLQKAFASLVFYGLYKDMFRRGLQEQITHAVVFDEAHRAARLRLIPTMAKECRKYGISLVLASQEAKDFNPSLFSAVANYLALRLNEADAKMLLRNVTTSDQERVLVDKLKQMERFKALYFCEGRKKPSPLALSS